MSAVNDSSPRRGRRLVLVGAGGAGREVHALIRTSPRFLAAEQIDEIVFVDDVADRTGLPELPAPIVSTVDDYRPADHDVVLCTIGEPRSRAAVVRRLEAVGARFTTFVHDTALLLPGASVGAGSVVYPFVVVSPDVIVGRFAWLSIGSVLGHDVTVGDVVTLSSTSQVLGGVTVGDRTFVACGAIVVPGVEVGADARIGAGSVVLRRVTPGTTVFGTPATLLAGAAR